MSRVCPSILSYLLAAGVAAAAPALTLPPGAEEAEKRITADQLLGPVRFLSHDLLEGRGASSRGDELARTYIAGMFEFLGLKPGGPDGSWQQPFDIVGITAAVPKSWTFKAGEQELTLKYWDEFIAGSGVQSESAAIEDAEVVFVGYGIVAPEYGWDDFKGADLKGNVLLMLNNDPDWDPELFAGKTRLYYGRWSYKYESAARQGAAGAIIIHTTPSAGYPFQVVQTSWSGEQYELPAEGEPRIQVAAWATEDATRRLLSAAGKDLDQLIEAAHQKDFRPVALGVTTSLELTNTIKRLQTANVLGLLPGSDPELKDEVVVYTAHHDHLGVGEPDASGDTIYNGARDNASGVAQMLAIAKAMQSLPQAPRRSILFNAVGVEESGLLGSKYYAAHPTFPAGKIAATINFDSANIWGRTKDVTIVGFGKSSLDQIAVAAAARQGRTVLGDQFPDRGYYYRSDQFSFAKIGVPALYIDQGTDFVGRPAGWGQEVVEQYEAKNYHQPSDEYDPNWNLEGAVEDAQFGLICGLAAAEMDALPTWVPGDEFEAARKQALEAVRE